MFGGVKECLDLDHWTEVQNFAVSQEDLRNCRVCVCGQTNSWTVNLGKMVAEANWEHLEFDDLKVQGLAASPEGLQNCKECVYAQMDC